MNRTQIHALYPRLSVAEDPRCTGDDPLLETRSSGSRGVVEVEAVRTDGQRTTVRIARAPGHPSRALTWDDLAAKFMDCATQARINPGKAERAFGILKRRMAPMALRSLGFGLSVHFYIILSATLYPL